jgi:hypothetical protein
VVLSFGEREEISRRLAVRESGWVIAAALGRHGDGIVNLGGGRATGMIGGLVG